MKMESLGFSLSFSYFFLPHTLFQGSEREDFIRRAEPISAACKGIVGHSSCGDIPFKGFEQRGGSSSCIDICCTLFTMGI